MKAVGYYQSLPIDHPDALLDLELPEPTPGPRDLLVEVRAISVNPVDTKVRQRAQPEAGQAKVLGWDAAGVVRAVGSEVSLFRPGDRVWYAGDITRPGSNSEPASGRRAHCRAPAEKPRLRPGRGPAADHHHCLGTALRALADRRRQGRPGPEPAGGRCRRRGRFDPGPTGPATDRPERDRHRFARRDPGLGPRPRRAPCDRPRQAAGRRS